MGDLPAREVSMRGVDGYTWKPLTGLLGRGEITSVTVQGKPLKPNDTSDHKCTVTVNVYLDNVAMFPVTVEQEFDGATIPHLSVAGAVYAVRVNPEDHSLVAIDLDSAVPEVTLAPASDPTHTAAYILEHGTPITVELGNSERRGEKNADGVEMYALELTVTNGTSAPYLVTVANPVPDTALPNLHPGSRMHAKLGSEPNFVIVDWAAGPLN
jgi:hypothetical protein